MNWKTIFKSLKNRDMQKRVGIVLGLVVVYRFLAHIPVPLAEPTKLKEVIDSVVNSTDFGGFLNLLSGGALASFSIVLVGLSPFITASIITQLLTKAIPKLEELHKDGESGRRKINQWTRLLSVPLAIVQSIAFIFILRQTVLAGNTTVLDNATPIEWIVAVTAMTAGALVLMWLGELITEQGVGNGISMLIFAGISVSCQARWHPSAHRLSIPQTGRSMSSTGSRFRSIRLQHGWRWLSPSHRSLFFICW